MKNYLILICVALISFTTMSFSPETKLKSISKILKEVESNNNPEAIGDDGLAFGVLQIHEPCILDVNKHYGTNYTHEDAKNPKIAEDIFIKYLSLGIKLYKKKCKVMPNEYDLVRMWNGGIYRGYEYEETIHYLNKYKVHKELIRSRMENS
jgi:hypothetical protein